MIHDEIYELLGDVVIEKTKLENITSHAMESIKHLYKIGKPVGFYFDETVLDNLELQETAREFAKAGLLKLPYKSCIFHVDINRFGKPTPTSLILGEDASERIIIFVHYRDDQGSGLRGGYLVVEKDFSSIFTDNLHESFEVNSEYSDNFCHTMVAILSVCILMLNNPSYQKNKTIIEDRLQKSRIKRGRSTLQNYVHVRLRPEIKSSLISDSGILRAPHWRRGHLRHYKNGLIVPVQPHIVGWEGDSNEIEKKHYKI